MKIIHSMWINPKRLLSFLILMASIALPPGIGIDDEKKVEMVVLSTEYGDMTILLYDDTPLHKANFLKLVEEGYYNDLLFHRVINKFMVQGGDPESRDAAKGDRLGNGGPSYTIPAEIRPNHIHKKGALAAARLGDAQNPKKESSGSQFYIVHGNTTTASTLEQMFTQRKRNNSADSIGYTPEQIAAYEKWGGAPHLDGGYTVFGEVIEGLDIIDSIAARATDRNNRPLEDVKMTMKIVKRKWQ